MIDYYFKHPLISINTHGIDKFINFIKVYQRKALKIQ